MKLSSTPNDDIGEFVTPFTGVWIEIRTEAIPATMRARHTLHGCVD